MVDCLIVRSKAARRAATATIVVAGDCSTDRHIASEAAVRAGSRSPEFEGSARVANASGGAALLADLLKAAPGAHRMQVHGPAEHEPSRTPQCLVLWARGTDRGGAWRVTRYLGVEPPPDVAKADAPAEARDPSRADIVVLDEHGLGFAARRHALPAALAGRSRPWIVCGITTPVSAIRWWGPLVAAHADRMIAVVSARDLRSAGARVSRGISWERTAADVVWSLRFDPNLAALRRCAWIVVTIGMEGALLLSNPGTGRSRTRDGRPAQTLVFDPASQEGEWEARLAGSVPGGRACMTASLVHQLRRAPAQLDLVLALQRGLAAWRGLHRSGWSETSPARTGAAPQFPSEAVMADIARTDRPLPVVAVPDPARADETGPRRRAGGPWSILGQTCGDSAVALAEQVVREGPAVAFRNVPSDRYGRLLQVERSEIEAYRELAHGIRRHIESKSARPFSLGVFGPPGCGKSFGVREMAGAIFPGRTETIEFNLAQLGDAGGLPEAMHRVRDIGVTGRIPVVFWDEFDAELGGRPLGWLAHLLAPTQEGTFQDGAATHRVGPAVFVFAGGISPSYAHFTKRTREPGMSRVKAPDFQGRLDAGLDVAGPNPRSDWPGSDPLMVIRRAILLRSILASRYPALISREGGGERLEIDSAVLGALLNVRRYHHGARSLEKLILACGLSGMTRFDASVLPTERVLADFVPAAEFMALLDRPELGDAQLDTMARVLHERFVDRLRARGFRYGRRTSEAARIHSSMMRYDRLPQHERDQNRDNARTIQGKLAAIGCVPVRGAPAESSFEFTKPEVEYLAELEHERWNRLKLMSGWRWARETDKERRLHRDLRPWSRISLAERRRRYGSATEARVGPEGLSETAREKDRALVRDIVSALAAIGYTIRRQEVPPDGRTLARERRRRRAGRRSRASRHRRR